MSEDVDPRLPPTLGADLRAVKVRSEAYAIRASVVDVRHADVLENVIVRIEGPRIVSVNSERPRPSDEVLDFEGGFVVPGLWNVHTHMGSNSPHTLEEDTETVGRRTIRAGLNLISAVAHGITGVRNLSEPSGIDLAWRDAIVRGSVLGPHVVACGEAIVPTGGHSHNAPGHLQADGPAGFREAVRSQLSLGVDQIKLMVSGGIATANETIEESQAMPDEIEAAVQLAHRKGRRVTAHAGGAQSVKDAVRAGVDCIEHGYQLDEEAVALMAERGTFYVPTLFVTNSAALLVKRHAAPHVIDKVLSTRPLHQQSFQMALDAGLSIASGADTNPIGENALVELEHLVREGMTAAQALAAATLTAARLCDLEHVTGAIEAGKRADLLVLGSDPLAHVAALRAPLMVMAGGRILRN